MLRNLILLISSSAVLILLFVVYLSLVDAPSKSVTVDSEQRVELPETGNVAEDKKLSVQGVDVDPGGKMIWIKYDYATGKPTELVSCERWEKVAGTQDEVSISEPKLMMQLPTGMVVTITARCGQIKTEWIQSKSMRPKLGWLAGDVRIVFDRETKDDRPPLEERPEDKIVIEMDRMDFDLELGELKTGADLHVECSEFDLDGHGLHLIWNQDDNRVEKLLIESGRQMTLKGELLDMLGQSPQSESPATTRPVVTRPAGADRPSVRQSRRKSTSYSCAFTGDVAVVHYVGDERKIALAAEDLSLLFDLGSGDKNQGFGHRPKTPTTTSAPTSAPSTQPEKRFVVRWSGPLLIRPSEPLREPQQRRRRFEATGDPVTVDFPSGRVRCSRLLMHEESKRLWLYPVRGGQVELSSGGDIFVRASSLFVDLDQNLVKLVGDVLFESAAGKDAALSIRANLWAELHLTPEDHRERDPATNLFENPLGSQPLESALFVGDVAVEYEGQQLKSHRLEAVFGAAEAGLDSASESAALRGMLKTAIATGDVALRMNDARRKPDWSTILKRNVLVLQRSLLDTLTGEMAGGSQKTKPEDGRGLTCARLQLDFDPTAGQARLERLEGIGAVEIHDSDSRFHARGDRVKADFVSNEQLNRATVTGTPANPAVVRASAYALRGQEIEVDNQARTLHVAGRSKLAFRSRRGLQGLTRGRAETITVTSTESLHVDQSANTVTFVGQVAAGTDNEKLLADSLVLQLEDVDATAQLSGLTGAALARGKPLLNLWGKSRRTGDTPAGLFSVAKSSGSQRKELARLEAVNAVIQAETYQMGDPEPLVHQSIAAPELRVDLKQRYIRTIGETTMLMTDRRRPKITGKARPSLDMASALINNGPSQTAMACQDGLIYTLGAEGPHRRDTILMKGGVRFRRVTGREMYNFEQLLPDVARDPELMNQLIDRNTALDCDRLEGVFLIPDESQRAQVALNPSSSLEVALLNASNNVYLVDQQGDKKITIQANQLEFDNISKVIRLLGLASRNIDASLSIENRLTGQPIGTTESPEIIYNLETQTIDARDLKGEASAP